MWEGGCFEKGSGFNVVCVRKCDLSGWIFFEGDTNFNAHEF